MQTSITAVFGGVALVTARLSLWFTPRTSKIFSGSKHAVPHHAVPGHI